MKDFTFEKIWKEPETGFWRKQLMCNNLLVKAQQIQVLKPIKLFKFLISIKVREN